MVLGVSLLILAGIFLERLLYIQPAEPIQAATLIFESLLLLILFGTFLASRAFDAEGLQRKTGED